MLATKSTIFQRFANLPLNDALCEPISFSLCMSARSAVSKVLVSQALSGLPWLTLAHFLSLAHSVTVTPTHYGSLGLTLTQFRSLWLSLWPSEALIGSQGPCSARSSAATLTHFIQVYRGGTYSKPKYAKVIVKRLLYLFQPTKHALTWL